MINELKAILEMAIKEEVFFSEFYKKAAEMADDGSAKTMLLSLSRIEAIHREKLETLDANKLGALILPDMITKEDIEAEIELLDISGFIDLREVLQFALSAEERAKLTYQKLGDAIDDKKAKSLFYMLANEEENHYNLISAEIERLG